MYYNSIKVTGSDKQAVATFYARELNNQPLWQSSIIVGHGFIIEYQPSHERLARSELVALSKKYSRLLFCHYFHSENKEGEIREAGVVHLKNGQVISKKISTGSPANRIYRKFMKSIRESMNKK